jgi:hypothetical protein
LFTDIDSKIKVEMRILIFALGTQLVSCVLINSHHHITLDHNITLKIEKEVSQFIDELYSE